MSVPVRVRNLEKNFGRYPALKGVSLDVTAGELVALLGPSGSGKTTLLRAVAGLEQVDGGEVFFGDIDATSLSLRERRIGFVFQHYALFRHMRVFDNIAFGLRARPRASRPSPEVIRHKVTELLSLVQLEGLEQRYPNQLSGGQRQRLAIARAIYKDAPILILDEATSALDTASEQAVKDALNVLMQGRTSLVIAHRLSTIEHADLIVVMQAGSIVETGTHNQLMAQGGAYAALYQVAAQSTDNHFSDANTL